MLLPWSHCGSACIHPQRSDCDADSLPDVLPHSHAIGDTNLDFYSDFHEHHDGNTQPQHDPDQHADQHADQHFHCNTDTNRHAYQPTADPDPYTHIHANVYPFKYQYAHPDRYTIPHCYSLI
jgi:hypothetical protein